MIYPAAYLGCTPIFPDRPVKYLRFSYLSIMPGKTLRFGAIIRIYNGNPYVLMSATRAQSLQSGWRKPMPVKVRINDMPEKAWPINMMPIGDGSYYLYLHGHVRKSSGTKVGDRVRVEVAFDGGYKSGPQPMPAWFRKALKAAPKAEIAYHALTPSRRKELVRYLARLVSQEARDRNVAKALEVLSGKPGRFLARSWKNGA